MHAAPRLLLQSLLAPLTLAALLAAPNALAKKDLFANEPGAKHTPPAEQLAPASSAAPEATQHEAANREAKPESARANTTTETQVKAQKNAVDETQFERMKRHLTQAKNDIFGSKENVEKKLTPAPELETQTETAATDTTTKADIVTLSTTEAAQRAQTFAEGQVINVRQYQAEDQPRYAVKLLQKNGRMKTINLDAVNGALIEEKPVEEPPQ